MNKNQDFPTYLHGVQTNCMSCHAMATTSTKTSYVTDMYIDMKNKNYFGGGVQADFAWSIVDNLNPPKKK